MLWALRSPSIGSNSKGEEEVRLDLGSRSWRGEDVKEQEGRLWSWGCKQRTRLGNADAELEVLCGRRTGRARDMVAGLCHSGIVHGLPAPHPQ